jgi:hypothetical protein
MTVNKTDVQKRYGLLAYFLGCAFFPPYLLLILLFTQSNPFDLLVICFLVISGLLAVLPTGRYLHISSSINLILSAFLFTFFNLRYWESEFSRDYVLPFGLYLGEFFTSVWPMWVGLSLIAVSGYLFRRSRSLAGRIVFLLPVVVGGVLPILFAFAASYRMNP